MAQKAMPLPADPEPVEVIYEDDAIVAVNKPPGVISAPKHRYKVGSHDFLRHPEHQRSALSDPVLYSLAA